MKTVLLIDGENFKRKAELVFIENRRKKPLWHTYRFKDLFDRVLSGIFIDERIFYSARIKEHPSTQEKSKVLISEQRLLKTRLEGQGFEVTLSGRVRGQLESRHNSEKILVFKEKGVDVKIAVDMMSMACDKEVGTIILGSSDSDLQPAIAEVRRRGISCVYLGFESQPNKGISYTTNRTILIRNSEVLECAE